MTPDKRARLAEIKAEFSRSPSGRPSHHEWLITELESAWSQLSEAVDLLTEAKSWIDSEFNEGTSISNQIKEFLTNLKGRGE